MSPQLATVILSSSSSSLSPIAGGGGDVAAETKPALQKFDVYALTDGSVRPMSATERKSIELRQLRHPASDMVGVSSTSLCRHGWPQAALWQPIGSQRPVSGIMRLTCPHLVKEIDEWEREGALDAFNRRLNDPLDEGRRTAILDEANKEHRRLRRAMMSDGDLANLEERFGAAGATAFMDSGIAGMSPTKLDDVKCLHAQLADYILRGYNEQSVGAEVRTALEEERGVSLGGCSNCHEQCDWRTPETETSWKYQAQKNKSRLRQRSARRQFIKARRSLKEAKGGAVDVAAAAAESAVIMNKESNERPS